MLWSVAFISAPLLAEEGGNGHYFPRCNASFVDGVPSQPGFIACLKYLHYEGSLGADLGDCKARDHSIGPEISYTTARAGGRDLIAEFKWPHEFDHQKRPEGGTIFLEVLVKCRSRSESAAHYNSTRSIPCSRISSMKRCCQFWPSSWLAISMTM